MIISIYRDSALLFQSSEIIAWSFDSLSLSGVDYWSQEARQASITVLYSPALQDILEGNLREIATGFHTLNFVIINGAQTLFAGVLEVGAFKVEYLSLTDKKVELNLLDYFGLLIRLAEDRKHQIGETTHPINVLPGIILSCFTQQTEAERNSNTPASVIRLQQALGCLSWDNAVQSYSSGPWLPWFVANYEIYNYDSDSVGGNIWNEVYDITFGMIIHNDRLAVYFRQHLCFYNPEHPIMWDGAYRGYIEIYKLRIYYIDMNSLTLCGYADLISLDIHAPLQILPPLDVFQVWWGECNYEVSGHRILYSGQVALGEFETVPGWYSCKDLLSEYLRISHAVLLNETGLYQVRNRLDNDLPLFRIPDPISASFNEAEPIDSISSSPISLASLALVEAVDRYYTMFLSSRSLFHEAEVKLVDSQLPSLISMSGSDVPPSNPYHLIGCRLWFDNRIIYPKEVDYDVATGEISYLGWS